ncbi:hypothetical protein K1W54_04695 [Micromonospora sp. CPCC 205371]|nr:hypothetical protein [Micromonospora sp. CPCC 205371]
MTATGCGELFEGEGCIDGTWYGFCDEPNCSGACDAKGDCGCTGCDQEICCARPGAPTAADAVRAAAAEMRRQFRLPEDAVITVVPPAPFVAGMRTATRDDPTLFVSDEKVRDSHG